MFHKGKHNREKQLRFSIRKVSFGAASVAVAALFMFLGNGAVSAAEQGVPSTNGETQAPQPKDQNIQNGTYEGNTVAISPAATVETNTQPSTVENSSSPESAPQKVETLDKKELTDLIKEIDGKLSQGTYASKTDNSVNQLKTALDEAKSVLNKAKTQAELSQAHANLVVATTKLQTKPEEKKEVAAVDTTNGKATVGKKATNTEKSSESNSIANSGSKDERNGKALDANNPFRTDTTPSTTDDTSANQVFDNPAEGADVKTLSNKLESLPETIQNNEKIQNMDELGKAKNVDKGKVVEIYEFGGWNAVAADGKPGKFAIARKTDKGVFPIETVNTVWDSKGKTYQTWVLEQSFDRTSDYMLFLSKVRTQADSKEETFDGSNYVHTGEGRQIAKGVKGFNGIQKTFKAYSKEHGSKVVVSFKTGYTGDIEGTKAQYKVEVIINRNGKEEKLYDQTFKPQEAQQNDEMTVVKASDGKNSPKFITTPDNPSPTKEDLEAKIANNKPNGTGGTFTSKEIEIPKGVTEYTVRISSADNQHLGMGYQSVHRHYALPLTGSNFSIKQDTKNVAKDLLQRIYNRLVEQKSEDTKWSTPETKGAYETKLTEINALLNSGINTTSNYKESAKLLIEKYKSLNNRDTIVEAAKADLVEAAKAEKAEIAADKSLTEAERKEKETAVDTKKAEEEAKITAAENADKVAEAKTAGVTAIKGVHTPGNLDTVKEAAKADLAEAAKAEKAEIAADKSLTEAERKEKETAVDTKKAEEEAKITAAENADKVAEAKTAGVTAIKGVHTPGNLDTVKEAAKADLAEAAKAEKAEIAADKSLTESERKEKETAVDTKK
ncbi:YSIRK-type signal peptide-containing protein, partial [Streptococcus mitis]|uniref:YSIRK-type signal peptide-containing protein n=1 Tax=Streptococcus mitis TaxID=28037 RepID=UPI0039C0D0F9